MFRLMEKARKNNKGFSLVELIVVVLIIAIIAVALAPQVVKYVQKSRDNVALNNAATIKSAVQAAVAEYQGDVTSDTYELTKNYTFTVAKANSALGGDGAKDLPEKLRTAINENLGGAALDKAHTVTITQTGKVTVDNK